jgi:hypothetical protein
MPLARLENFLKNLNGNTLYVDPNELDASDSIDNKGNSRLRPFKTIQRALIEAARFAYIPGTNNDLFDQTSILISPGTHFIDNRPGYYVDGGALKDVNGATRTITEFNVSTNFDLTDPANQLYIYNSATGGVIIPKGTSIVAQDLRKTKIKPKFVPNPVDDNISASSIFQLTGACYIYGFTIFDGDPVGKVYNSYSTNTTVPNYSHHKLTAFEYADDRNNIFKNGVDTGHTDLENYYYKLSLAYGAQSSRSIIDGYANFQPNVDENRIVGELGVGEIVITSVISGNGVSGTNVITVQTQTEHGLSPFTPIIISGVGQDEGPTTELEYNGNFIVAQVTSATEFTYLLSNVPTNTLNPSITGATLKVISDTVSSASPYVFNCSLKSVYGMNGLHADGSRTTGFKSIVTAQFTGISLQKDDRAFVEYDEASGAYKYQDNFGVDKFLHQSSLARYRPSWESVHIKASNDAFIQCVSIFAIGYAKQFSSIDGGDQSITNSNSNFGAISLYSSGFKNNVLAKDNHAFITHIIPPKDVSQTENEIRFVQLDAQLTSNLAASNQNTRVYLNEYTDLLNPPTGKYRGYSIGGKPNDVIFYNKTNVTYEIPISPSGTLEYDIIDIDTDTNIITLSGISGISTGISGKIIAQNAKLPDGIAFDKLYNVRLTGGNGIKLYDNLLNSEFDSSVVDIKNQVGLIAGNLKFASRVSDKDSGSVGHPIQWDSTNQNWYVGVNSVGAGATEFFFNLTTIQAPSSYIKRQIDTRNSSDRLYRVRIVIPKESQNSSDLSSGFIIQKASNALNSLLFQASSTELVSSSGNQLAQIRNKGAIVDAWYDTGTVTVITSVPHNLKTGDSIQIYNLKSSAEPAPVGLGTGYGYNGSFTVASVVNNIRFTYSLNRNPGTITEGSSSVESWLTTRDCLQTSNYRIPPYTIYDANRNNLPYFVCKEIENDYQLYDIETIQNYVEGSSDGIYHVILNVFKNIPDSIPFNTSEYKISQSIERLYPQQDVDNPSSDPEPTVSSASRKEIGIIDINTTRNSVSKETTISYLKDFNLATSITGISTYYDGVAGICSASTSQNHGIGGIRRLTISSAGTGYVNGTYYDIPLCGGSGLNATANITVASNVVSSVEIQNNGSGYVIGDSLQLRGIPGSSNVATVIVNTLFYSSTNPDTIQILGATNSQNNGTFIIKSVTSNTITYYNSVGIPETPNNAVAMLAGIGYQLDVTPDGAVYNNITNLTTITTQTPHTFAVGNKVIFDDQIGLEPTIGISTVASIIGISTFTVRGDAGSANRVYGVGLLSNPKDTSAENENLASRHFSIYTGYKSKLSQAITQTNVNFLVADLYGLKKGDTIQVNAEIMLVTKISGGEIYVKRGLFGSRPVSHESGSGIKGIQVIPIELRRNSIIRASGHTFEYTGFGPGNYSTGMPTNQDRILSDNEVATSQSLATKGGLVVYTGMNSAGEFFIGKIKFDSVTGKQIDVGVPIEASDGTTSVDLIYANNIIVNDQLDGSTASATFNKLIVSNDINIAGIITSSNTTPSSSCTTGAIVVAGGIGIGGNSNICGTLNVSSTLGVTGDTTLSSLGVTGDTTLSSLSVTGVTTLSSLGVTGVTTLSSLSVTGVTTLSSLSVTGVTTATKFVGNGTIPVGGIIMWSGSVASIPSGWALCNGSNGTPNLQDRFVVAAGSGYNVGATGGSANATLVSHSHTATSTPDDPGHDHTVDGTYDVSSNNGLRLGGSNTVLVSATKTTSNKTTGITVATTISTEGSSATNANLPPYYALAFIMRTV